MNRISRLFIHVPDTCSGQLEHTSRHVFAYDASVLDKPAAAISLTMPVRLASYEHTLMLPALQTFIPVGFIAERIRNRLGKTIKMTAMSLLALSAGDAIGRLRVSLYRNAPMTQPSPPRHQKKKSASKRVPRRILVNTS